MEEVELRKVRIARKKDKLGYSCMVEYSLADVTDYEQRDETGELQQKVLGVDTIAEFIEPENYHLDGQKVPCKALLETETRIVFKDNRRTRGMVAKAIWPVKSAS